MEALGRALENFVGTVIFISHNRTFINSIATLILEINDGQVRRHVGTFEDYVYYLENYVASLPLSEGEVGGGVPSVIPASHCLPLPEGEIKRGCSLKHHRKTLKKLEEEITELEKEKNRLSKKQAKNPTKFATEDYARLGEVMKLIEEKEEKWLETEDELNKKYS